MKETIILAIFSMAGLAALFAAVLSFADKKLRVQEDPKIDELVHLLPGVNCGACGYIGCRDFAEHMVKGDADPIKCRVIHDETRKEIFSILGEAAEEVFKSVPLMLCSAPRGQKKQKGEYRGVATCTSAQMVFGAGIDCEYGCLGFADCVRACPFGALRMVEGLPKVDYSKCTGCGKCALACPRKIVEMVEQRNKEIFYVACSSRDSMMRTREVCKVGCIACGICAKLSQDVLFAVKDNLSRADYSKQKDPGPVRAIQGKCPTKVIKDI